MAGISPSRSMHLSQSPLVRAFPTRRLIISAPVSACFRRQAWRRAPSSSNDDRAARRSRGAYRGAGLILGGFVGLIVERHCWLLAARVGVKFVLASRAPAYADCRQRLHRPGAGQANKEPPNEDSCLNADEVSQIRRKSHSIFNLKLRTSLSLFF